MNKKIAKKIVSCGDKYIEQHLANDYDKKIMNNDWWEGSKFFIRRTFYQGRADIVSKKVEKAAMDILNRYFKDKPPSELKKYFPDFSKINKQLNEVIGKGKVGKGGDVEMIIGTLKFIAKKKQRNLALYSISKIKEGAIQDHYRELQQIRSIGPKISSFYLRDLVCFYDLERFLSDEDLIFLQPVDTWIRKLAYRIGISDKLKLNDSEIRKRIVQMCRELDIPSIKFNQGA